MHILKFIPRVLGSLLVFTDVLSAVAYVTVPYVKTVLHLFGSDLLAPKQDDTDLTGSLKGLKYLREQYDDPASQQ